MVGGRRGDAGLNMPELGPVPNTFARCLAQDLASWWPSSSGDEECDASAGT